MDHFVFYQLFGLGNLEAFLVKHRICDDGELEEVAALLLVAEVALGDVKLLVLVSVIRIIVVLQLVPYLESVIPNYLFETEFMISRVLFLALVNCKRDVPHVLSVLRIKVFFENDSVKFVYGGRFTKNFVVFVSEQILSVLVSENHLKALGLFAVSAFFLNNYHCVVDHV